MISKCLWWFGMYPLHIWWNSTAGNLFLMFSFKKDYSDFLYHLESVLIGTWFQTLWQSVFSKDGYNILSFHMLFSNMTLPVSAWEAESISPPLNLGGLCDWFDWWSAVKIMLRYLQMYFLSNLDICASWLLAVSHTVKALLSSDHAVRSLNHGLWDNIWKMKEALEHWRKRLKNE